MDRAANTSLSVVLSVVCGCGGSAGTESVIIPSSEIIPSSKVEAGESIDSKDTLPAAEELRRRASINEARIALAQITTIGGANTLAEGKGICGLSSSGRIGPTPPLEVLCSDAPDGRCVGTVSPSKPWEYDPKLWDDPAWKTLNFRRVEGIEYHFSVRWFEEQVDGEARCTVVATAQADLDGDGLFSKIEKDTRGFGDGPDGLPIFTKLEDEYE